MHAMGNPFAKSSPSTQRRSDLPVSLYDGQDQDNEEQDGSWQQHQDARPSG